MTDVSDGSGPIPRRTPRASDGGAPVSGALAIVLAVVAVVAGFLILRSIAGDDPQGLGVPSTGDGGSSAGSLPAGGTTVPNGSVVPIPSAAPTTPTTVKTGATVVVANASFLGGTAAQMSTALTAAGFTMGDPTNAAALTDAMTASIIYYDATQVAAKPVADALSETLGGGVSVLPLEGTPNIESGNLNGAGVLLMLGTDKAGRTLEELNPAAAGAAAPTQITNPPLGAVTSPATSAP